MDSSIATTELQVSVQEGCGDCEQCGGGMEIQVTVRRGDKEVIVKRGGCFGYDLAEVIKEVIEKWEST